MPKILICGATGFLGRNLSEWFLKIGYEVHGVCHNKYLNGPPYHRIYNEKHISWHQADLRNERQVSNLFNIIKPDILLQFAASTSGCKDTLESPALHTTNNTVMNALIFKEAIDAGVSHVIFPSCSVMLPNGHCTEETVPDVKKHYAGFAWTKMYCERLCEFYSEVSGTKFTVMRNSNIFGPHDKFDLSKSHVFGATITKVMTADDKILVWGTGKEARDLLYVDDLCRFVQMAIEKQADKFKLYNCASGVTVSINDLVSEIITASGKKINIEHDLSAPSIPTSVSLNCTKAKEELGWEPQVNLEEGIVRTIEWYKDNILSDGK